MTDHLSMPLMPLMTPLSSWHTGGTLGGRKLLTASPAPGFGVEDNEEKDENNCEDEVTVRFGDYDDYDNDDGDDDNNQRTAAHSGGVCGAVLILDIAQLSQISQQRLSHIFTIITHYHDYHTAARDYHD